MLIVSVIHTASSLASRLSDTVRLTLNCESLKEHEMDKVMNAIFVIENLQHFKASNSISIPSLISRKSITA